MTARLVQLIGEIRRGAVPPDPLTPASSDPPSATSVCPPAIQDHRAGFRPRLCDLLEAAHFRCPQAGGGQRAVGAQPTHHGRRTLLLPGLVRPLPRLSPPASHMPPPSPP